MFERFSRLLPKSAFLRDVGLLTGGTVVAQAISALALPILTRLYKPEDFSLLAVYAAILGLITVVSCLRFQLAIAIPRDDDEAMVLMALSVLGAIATSALLIAIIWLAADPLLLLIKQPAMKPYLWMIPVGVFFASIYDALQYWASRTRRYGIVVKTRLTRSILGALAQIGLRFITLPPFGLLFGYMVYSGIGSFGILRSIYVHDRPAFAALRWHAIKATFKKYIQYPLYSVPEALLNTAGLQVPIIAIAGAGVGPEAGSLMLAMQIMGMPLVLVGKSVAQVYLVEAPQKLREGTLAAFTKKTVMSLLKVGGPPLIVAAVVSPFLFPLIFGPEWARAGIMMVWLTPWFLLQFVASPISVVLNVTGNLRLAMVIQAIGFVGRTGAVVAALMVSKELAIEIFALSSAVFYGFNLYIIIRTLEKRESVGRNG